MVAREAEVLQSLGKVSSMARELSPLQVGTRGHFNGRDFELVGVVRLGRERVRWNEWCIRYADGELTWLGEGNGQFQLFFDAVPAHEAAAKSALDALALGRGLAPGTQLDIGGISWRVAECATAMVIAAEGELPGRFVPNTPRRYLDLRTETGSRVGTLDSDGPTLFIGEVVELTALSLTGLRHFAGWSDPVLVNYAGPEIETVRALVCPNCGGSLTQRAPGASVWLVCPWCGSDLALGEGPEASFAQLAKQATEKLWSPLLPLGTRGRIRDVEWEVIGAMIRSVNEEGVRYPWEEYLLHNPYRGFVWLVHNQGHWNFVRLLTEAPAQAENVRTITWRGTKFTRKDSGSVVVDKVLGEFTWEVHVGDRAMGTDWVSGKLMLSREATADEVTWSLGEYLPPNALKDFLPATGGSAERPRGTAPNQPGAYSGATRRAMVMSTILMGIAWLGLFVAEYQVSSPTTIYRTTLMTSTDAEDVWISEPFEVIKQVDQNLTLSVREAIPYGTGKVYVSLIHTETWTAYSPEVDDADDFESVTLSGVEAGPYVARIEVVKPEGTDHSPGQQVTVDIRQGTMDIGLLMLFPFFLVGGIFLYVLAEATAAARREGGME